MAIADWGLKPSAEITTRWIRFYPFYIAVDVKGNEKEAWPYTGF